MSHWGLVKTFIAPSCCQPSFLFGVFWVLYILYNCALFRLRRDYHLRGNKKHLRGNKKYTVGNKKEMDGPGGTSAPPDPPHCFRLRRYGRRIFRPNFFVRGGQGGRSRSFHFKKFAKANFLKWCRGGVWGGLHPQESPFPVPCPPGGSGGLRPLRNLR